MHLDINDGLFGEMRCFLKGCVTSAHIPRELYFGGSIEGYFIP